MRKIETRTSKPIEFLEFPLKRSYKGRSTQRTSPARRVQSTAPDTSERRPFPFDLRRRGRSLTRDLEEDSNLTSNTTHTVAIQKVLAPTMAR